MIIQLISDIHLEFPNNYMKFMDSFIPKGDILIIAGDACNLANPKPFWNFLGNFQKDFQKIIYVPGNHEYYVLSLELVKSHQNLNEVYQANCQIVNNNVITIGKVNFFCSTLWTKPTQYAADRLNDYYAIKNMTRDENEKIHLYSINRLQHLLSENKQGYNYIVSHHLPLWEAVSPQYEGNPINSCFVSDQSQFIEDNKIHVWLHGHSHDSLDMQFKGTRIVRNPLGYVHVGEAAGYKEFVIDVPDNKKITTKKKNQK